MASLPTRIMTKPSKKTVKRIETVNAEDDKPIDTTPAQETKDIYDTPTVAALPHIKEKFHGRSDENFRQWFGYFKTLIRDRQLTTDQELELFRCGLAGAAWEHFAGFRQADVDTLEKAATAMINLYSPEHDIGYWLRKLRSAKQKNDETARLFAHQIRTLVMKADCGSTPESIGKHELDFFLEGLRPELHKLIVHAYPKTLEEALHLIELNEHKVSLKRKNTDTQLTILRRGEDEGELGEKLVESHPKRTKSDNNLETRMISKIDDKITSLEQKITNVLTEKLQQRKYHPYPHKVKRGGHRSNQNGRIDKKYPSRPNKPFTGKCFRCDQNGHRAADCPQRVVSSDEPTTSKEANASTKDLN